MDLQQASGPKFIGQDKATVGDSVQPTNHDLIEEIKFTIDNVTMTIYDTRGFGDTGTKDRSIVEAAIAKMKQADVILICHKLYGSVDRNSKTLLNELARGLGNDLMKHAIFVFTFGDDYLTRCEEPNDDPEAIKTHMETQESKVKKLLKQILLDNGIKEEIVNDIPSVITSGKNVKLPTSDNWVDELWGLCETCCKPEAGEFIGWWRRNATAIGTTIAGSTAAGAMTGYKYGGSGGAVAGAVGGAVGGAVVSAVGGAVGGAILGGAGKVAMGIKDAILGKNSTQKLKES